MATRRRGVHSILNEIYDRAKIELNERFGEEVHLSDAAFKKIHEELLSARGLVPECDILVGLDGHIPRTMWGEDDTKILKITKETPLVYVKVRDKNGHPLISVTVGTLLGIYDANLPLMSGNLEVYATFEHLYGNPYASEDPDA